MTDSKVIDRLIEFAPPILAWGTHVRARCIAATAIGCDVLRTFDIEAEPYAVVVEMANRAYVAAHARGADPVTAIARGGHLLISGANGSAGWPGHLLIHLPRLGYLIDLDFQQFRRDDQALDAAPAELLPWPSGTTSRAFVNPDGARLTLEATADRAWERSPDWCDRTRRRPLVDTLIRAIRKNRLPHTLTGGTHTHD